MTTTKPSARIILDSISPDGDRLTTMIATMHRFVLAEFNTHRALSRNSESSRAIPIAKRVARVRDDTAFPVAYGKNQRGMSAAVTVNDDEAVAAENLWWRAAKQAAHMAESLDYLGLHKQVANRLLEPFSWHTVLVSSTEWDNFYKLRVSSNAQPEMEAVAHAMLDAYRASTPVKRLYHVPFLDDPEYASDPNYRPTLDQIRQSVARCARTSYSHFNEETELDSDLRVFHKLATDGHWSPFEHIAWFNPALFCHTDDYGRLWRWNPRWGNFVGWEQLRFSEEGKRHEAARTT